MSGNGTVHRNAHHLKVIRMLLLIIIWKTWQVWLGNFDTLSDEYEDCMREHNGMRAKHRV